MTERMTVDKALAAVKASADGLYGVLHEHGTMELGFYRPVGTDDQGPHDQDEIYIVQSGTGVFQLDQARIEFGPGDALFVPAGAPHRFVEFSDDFATWVVFWGLPGGEQ